MNPFDMINALVDSGFLSIEAGLTKLDGEAFTSFSYSPKFETVTDLREFYDSKKEEMVEKANQAVADKEAAIGLIATAIDLDMSQIKAAFDL